jgi:uncharacterized protein DUF2213
LGEESFEAAEERDMAETRQLHLLGATGAPRTEVFDGREHLVVPVIALMEGVIHAVNAKDPEYVPAESLSETGWNGRPVVLGHPSKDGRQISANAPKVLEKHRFGTIFETTVSGSRLAMEAWVDPARLEALGEKELLQRVREGKPIEVSVGAFVTVDRSAGEWNGKRYKAVWKHISPDHLAFLPKGRGACSNEMGCGAHRAAAGREYETYLVAAEGLVAQDAMLTELEEVLRSAYGRRHSDKDLRMLQTVHDYATLLGASCGEMREAQSFLALEGESLDERLRAVSDAVMKMYPAKKSSEGYPSGMSGYPVATYDDYVIVRKPDGSLCQHSYTVEDDGSVTLSSDYTIVKEVRRYVAASSWLRDAGGPGSGWFAEGGHVPGGGAGGGKGKDGTGGGKGGGSKYEKLSKEDRNTLVKSHETAQKANEAAAAAFRAVPKSDRDSFSAQAGKASELGGKAIAATHGVMQQDEELTGEEAEENSPLVRAYSNVEAASSTTHADAARRHEVAARAHAQAAKQIKSLEELRFAGPMSDKAGTQRDCEHCDGTGRVKGKDCSYCDGMGQVRVASTAKQTPDGPKWYREAITPSSLSLGPAPKHINWYGGDKKGPSTWNGQTGA